jgi:hypothetical protein
MLLPILMLATASASPGELHLGASLGALKPVDGPAHFAWTAAPRATWWPNTTWGLGAELGAIPGLELDGHGFQALESRLGASYRPGSERSLAPLLGAGLALAAHDSQQRLNAPPEELVDRHLQAWAGLGASWRASPWLVARADLHWRQAFDGADPHRAATGLSLSLGVDLVQPLGSPEPPDRDGDGVADAQDSCPDQAGGAALQGCPAPEARPGVQPPDATIWIPHPHCQHGDAAEGLEHLDHLDADQPVVVSAPGYLPAFVPAEQLSGLQLEPAPPQGALVIVAAPGDEILVDGVRVPTGEDGVALLNVPEGSHAVEVSGGGRHANGTISVSQGHATWLRPPGPEHQHAFFAPGSSALSDAALEGIRALAAQRGGYGYVLQGGHSPEGDPELNKALAHARAAAVRAALIEAGVPEDRIGLMPIAEPTLSADEAAQRSCVITPVPGGTP